MVLARQAANKPKGVMVVRFLIGFMLGFMLGASIGLAFAPEPGERTRAKVAERMRERAHGSMGEPMEETRE